MPPRGYSRTGKSDKPTIKVQTKTVVEKKVDATVNRIADLVKGHLSGDIPVAQPTLRDNPNLKSQRVPKGFEAIDSLPDWAGGGKPRQAREKSLHHAIRLQGTNHIITSATPLSDKALQSLTDDYKRAISVVGNTFPNGVAMHVPGPGEQMPRGAHGWVSARQKDQRLFNIRPSLAKSPQEQKWHDKAKAYRAAKVADQASRGFEVGDPNDPKYGWNMPASEVFGDNRVYTMVHEMGHVNDLAKNDTELQSFGFSGKGHEFWQIQKSGLSRYGQTQTAEGYAEAFAQYHMGGKGSNKSADRYARIYGWVSTVVPALPEGVPA